MSDQIITKRCSKCKEIKPVSEFYKDKHEKSGYRRHCKLCCKHYAQSKKRKLTLKRYDQSEKGKAASKRYDQTKKGNARYKRFQQNSPEQVKAHRAISNAVRDGKIPRVASFQCSFCPAKAQEYHHPSYKPEHWFDVIPVCIDCHNKLPSG